MAEFNLSTKTTEAFDGIMMLDGADNRSHPLGNTAKIDRRWVYLGQTEFFSIFHQMVDVSTFNEGFAGDTAEMQAVAAQFLFFFNQKCFGTQLSGTRRHGQTASAATNDSDIIIVIGHIILPFRLRLYAAIFSFWSNDAIKTYNVILRM